MPDRLDVQREHCLVGRAYIWRTLDNILALIEVALNNDTDRNGIERNGTVRNDTGRNGTDENCTVNNGADRNCPHRNGIVRNPTNRNDTVDNGSVNNGTARNGTRRSICLDGTGILEYGNPAEYWQLETCALKLKVNTASHTLLLETVS